MSAVKFINPDGVTVEVPQADAAHFDAIGWERAEGAPAKKPAKK